MLHNISGGGSPDGSFDNLRSGAPEAQLPFGAHELAAPDLGRSAMAGFGGETAVPFGSDLMTAVPGFEPSEFAKRISGSNPTNRMTNVWNPHSKRNISMSDGSDTSGDD